VLRVTLLLFSPAAVLLSHRISDVAYGQTSGQNLTGTVEFYNSDGTRVALTITEVGGTSVQRTAPNFDYTLTESRIIQ
jgi:hypothetical protein